MIYYLDGYNFLFTQEKEDLPIEEARNEIIEYLSEKVLSLKLIVVFDAHNSHGQFSRTYHKNIEVIYSSHGQTADEFLIEKIQFSKKPQEITIVSNDKKLIKEAKDLRAHGLSFNNFFKKVTQKTKPQNEKPNPSSFGSSELKEYLKKFNL